MRHTFDTARHQLGRLRKGLHPSLAAVRNQHPGFAFTQLRYQDYHTFSGYYDRSPWSPDGRRLLMGAIKIHERLVNPEDRLLLLAYDFEQGEFSALVRTGAWNYQQGAQQHWINAESILFNDVVSGRYVTKTLDINAGKSATLAPFATAAHHLKCNMGVSIDFERLRVFEPAYGYPLLQLQADISGPEDLCLRLLDYGSGSSTVIFDVNDLHHSFPRAIDFEKYDYWLNHPKFNPRGTKIMFAVRSRLKNGPSTSPKARDLMVVDLKSGESKCVFDDAQWSRGAHHPTWFDDDRILINWRIDGQMRFVQFADAHESYEILSPDCAGSGHPTVDSSGRFLLTDDYPWRTGRYQPLRLIDLETGRSIILAEFHLPPSFDGPWRCDLHPRWKKDRLEICFDTAHDGMRSLGVASLSILIADEFSYA